MNWYKKSIIKEHATIVKFSSQYSFSEFQNIYHSNYGAWMDKNGTIYPVRGHQGHNKTAYEILKENPEMFLEYYDKRKIGERSGIDRERIKSDPKYYSYQLHHKIPITGDSILFDLNFVRMVFDGPPTVYSSKPTFAVQSLFPLTYSQRGAIKDIISFLEVPLEAQIVGQSSLTFKTEDAMEYLEQDRPSVGVEEKRYESPLAQFR